MAKAQAKTRTKTATHAEMARVHIKRHNQDVMYTRGIWYRYDAGVWSQYHDQEMSGDLWNVLEEYESKDRVRPSKGVKDSVMDMVKARLFVNEDRVDAAPHLINLTNGVFNLNDGRLYPHNPDFYLTTQLPFAYDPDATAPLWQMYLLSTLVEERSTTPDKELIEFVQEAVGYSLTTNVEHHVAFWCYGEGANGKGVLFHTLEQLGGTSAIALNIGLLHREQYQLANLAGKRIALCSEASATKNLVEDALVKSLVGGDTISVRQIRREPFMLQPTAKLWWSMNELPAVADTSEGFWRRMQVIPFNRQFKKGERILDLKERLDKELPGIFNWALAGLRRLRKMGGFTVPQQVKDSTERYRRESNPVVLFIEDECYIEKDIHKEALSSLVYTRYASWCKDNGFKPLSSKNLKHEMERLKHWPVRRARGVFFTGIGLKGA